ncbi:MAG: MSMEG_0565 family glycosyltransferase [Solirubrobacteraceae bacterium]
MTPLRIAVLTYSVKPRGGVVHALELSRALACRGHHVELAALARGGESFFREPAVPAHLIGHAPDPDVSFDERIAGMIAAYRDGLRPLLRDGGFDIVHAQDCLSANAVLGLRGEGTVDHVVRTVHHVDDFRSPSLIECQNRSIRQPDLLLCVSEAWVGRVRAEFGVEAGLVSNGVELTRFQPAAAPSDRDRDRAALDLGDRFCVLAIGGIEPRKGSLTLLEGFAELCRRMPRRRPLLVIAGGATLFDYRDEIDRFWQRAAELGIAQEVRALGPLADDRLAVAYRAADVLAFPSTKEGFGLVPLEALAAGLPVVASDLPVFHAFLRDGHNALLVPVGDAGALAGALQRIAAEPELAGRLHAAGRRTAASFSWPRVAKLHEDAYRSFLRHGAPVTARV